MADRSGISGITHLICFLLCFACVRPSTPPDQDKKHRKPLERINRIMVQKEDEVTANFIRRMGWDMKRTESGLWYMISGEGTGRNIEQDMTVMLFYRVSLLDGTVCYSSEQDGPKKIVVGRDRIEKGVGEGILLLREGDRAKFILPPHLAHGLLGDQNRIPARAILLYEIDSLKILH